MKNEYKPNYAVSPLETIKENLLYQSFGEDLARELETVGVTEKNVYLVEAMTQIPRTFLLKLQENYEINKKIIESDHLNKTKENTK